MEKNNKLLIVKILIAVLIISALIVVFFLFTKEEKEVILSSEDVKVKDSMLQLTFVGISIKMNDNTESVSKYCIAKELSMGKFWCIDYSGYFDIASGCGDDYRCQ
ncbi:MAG: hypothetical protein XD85_0299 [Parcubacteria bacterium 34_609]|nr:MAG: hypothetical protein XD85_0299 [Parcubacteria bacterium 34_609]